MSPNHTVRFLDRTSPPHIFTLIIVTAIGALAMNVFLPSLPRMAEDFGADYSIIQLSVAGYLGVNAVMQIFIGPVSDRFGRRPVLLAATAIFIVSTLGCMLAPTVEIFLAFRFLQAVIVSGLVLGRAIVRDLVPQDQAASMIGYVTMGMAVVPMIAPALGGVIDEVLGWRATFAMMAILGTAVLWLIWRDLGETAGATGRTLSDQVAEYPELFRSPRFWGYCACAAFASGAFFAYLGGAPFVGSEVFGLTPSQLGLFFGAPAVGYFFGNFLSGRYSVALGINAMILIGASAATVGLLLALTLFLSGAERPAVFFGFMTFVGLGNGMVLPNATAGMLSVRPRLAGSASGLGGAIMIGGGAALSAAAGALLTETTGAFPLLYLMTATSLLSCVSIGFVLLRERQVSLR